MRQTRTGSHGSSLACCGMTTKPPLLSKRPPQLAFDLAAPAVWAHSDQSTICTVSTLHVSHASCSGGNVPPTAAELCVRNSISLKTLFQNMTLALLNPEQHVIAQSIGALALWGFTVSAFGAVSSGSGPCATVWPLDLRRSEQMRRRVHGLSLRRSGGSTGVQRQSRIPCVEATSPLAYCNTLGYSNVVNH